MTLEKGTTLGGYRITGILGQGGMGVVYEAEQITLNRTVALKVLAPHLSDDILFRERFRREGQLQAGIDHPHIVTVYEAGDSDEGVFIAMRLIRGPNLKDMIVSRELDPGRTIRILTPIAEALDSAHEAGLIHRDIKPQNILVAGRDHAFLADFGLTKAAGEKSLTRTGQFVGTFDYISPEQVKGERATHQSDVYALAAVLYECLTGMVPFPKDSEAAVLYSQMADPPPKVTEERPELPLGLDEVIARGMAKDPALRYGSCGQLLLETSRTFTRRTRAAFTPPRPLEAPQETGIRPAELEVPTRESPAEVVPPTTERVVSEAGELAGAAPVERATGEAPSSPDAPELTVAATPDLPVATAAAATAPGTPAAPQTTVPASPDSGAARTEATEPAPAATRPATAATGPTAATAALPAAPGTTRARPDAGRGARAPAVLGLALLVAAVVAGLVLGRASGGSEDATPAANNVHAAGALELSYPDGWQRAQEPAAIPGLELENPVAISERGGARNALVAGTTSATGPSLLPAAFVRRLDETPPRDDAVRLGALDMYRYRDLRPDGFDGRVTLYVAPTSVGVATVACAATSGSAGTSLTACEDVARGLDLIRGEAFALGADKRYLTQLDETFGRLNRDREQAVRALRTAKTQAAQAKASDSIGKSYGRARRSLRGDSVSPAVRGAAASVRAALARTEAAYRRLAAAAKGGNNEAYAAVRKDVRAAEADVKRALRQVRVASGG